MLSTHRVADAQHLPRQREAFPQLLRCRTVPVYELPHLTRASELAVQMGRSRFQGEFTVPGAER
jgi:hypothetical protein